jgi:hypothetical protein
MKVTLTAQAQVGRWGQFQPNSVRSPRGTAGSPRRPGRDHWCQHRSYCGRQGRGSLLARNRRHGPGWRRSHQRRCHHGGGMLGGVLQHGKGDRSSEKERPGREGQSCCWSADAEVAVGKAAAQDNGLSE